MTDRGGGEQQDPTSLAGRPSLPAPSPHGTVAETALPLSSCVTWRVTQALGASPRPLWAGPRAPCRVPWRPGVFMRPGTQRALNKLRRQGDRSHPVSVPLVWKALACVAWGSEGPLGLGQTCSGCFFGVRVHQAKHGHFAHVPEGHPPTWRLGWPWGQRPAGAAGERHGHRTAGWLTGKAADLVMRAARGLAARAPRFLLEPRSPPPWRRE